MPNLWEEYEEIKEIAEQLQMGERTIISSLSLALFSSLLKMHEHQQQAYAIWQSSKWHLMPARVDHLGLLLSVLPMTFTTGQKRVGLVNVPFGMSTDLEKLNKAKKQSQQNLKTYCSF